MASKICPICEIFTSSSSNSLNAHIDQCLSGVAKITLKAKSKASKHRIEQRKMRSMVEIYAAAPYCTLEELDRRNGTNWASNSSLPAQDETCAEERKQEAPLNFDEMENEDSPYGAKLRTLSKITDQSSPEKIGEHPGPRRRVKGDQGSKFLLMKKKHGKKQHQLQRSALDSKKLCSPRPQHKSEIISGQEQDTASKEIYEKEEAFTQHRKTRNQVKFNDEQTGLKKKLHFKDDPQSPACTENKGSRGENNESSSGNSYVVKRGHLLRSPKASGNPPSPPKINKNVLSEPDHEYREELYLRKRARVSLMESEACNQGNPISSPSSLRVEMKRVLTRKGDRCVKAKQFSSKNKSLSSLRKKLESVSQASVPESKFSFKRICLAHQKTQARLASELEKGATINYSVENLSRVKARSEKKCDNVTVVRKKILKVRKVRAKSKISKKDKAMVLKGPKLAPGYREDDDDDKFDFAPGNFVSESASGMVNEEALMRKPLDGGFDDVAGFSDVQSDSREFVKVYEGPFLGTEYSRFPVEPIISGHEMFCTGGGETNLGENVQVRTKLDSSDDGPGNYYTEVDSIMIPGPPGSFLPSPCRMTSGNSSLISSLVQSSEDHPEFADMDYVDSPSATSTISNSDVAKFDLRFCGKLPLGPHSVKNEISSTVSGVTVDAMLDAAASLNSQEVPILWPQTVSSMPQSVSYKQIDIKNVTTYPLGHIQNEKSVNSDKKFPSKSNSVVRLMGKEIVVLKEDDIPLPQLRPSQLPMMNSRGKPESCTVSDVYSGNVQNKSHVVSQGLVFGPMQQNSATEDVDVTLSNGYNNCYYGTPQRPSWHVNPIQGYHHPRTSFPYGGLPPLQSPNLRTPPSSGVSSSHTMCNCVPLPQNGSFTSFTSPTYI